MAPLKMSEILGFSSIAVSVGSRDLCSNQRPGPKTLVKNIKNQRKPKARAQNPRKKHKKPLKNKILEESWAAWDVGTKTKSLRTLVKNLKNQRKPKANAQNPRKKPRKTKKTKFWRKVGQRGMWVLSCENLFFGVFLVFYEGFGPGPLVSFSFLGFLRGFWALTFGFLWFPFTLV